MILESVGTDDFQLAIKYASTGSVSFKKIEHTGQIVGEVGGTQTVIKLHPDGKLELVHSQETGPQLKSVALALACLRLLRLKKLNAKAMRLMAEAPQWFTKDFLLSLKIQREKGKSYDSSTFFAIEELQSYWGLLELASFPKNKIPADLLARHVMGLYGMEPWAMKVAAMEAMANRIKSVQTERLVVATGPERGLVFGTYKVGRKGQGVLNYDVLLSGNGGIRVSCSCKDFQKNTLLFCKHSAVVLEYWHENEKREKQFQGPVNEKKVHLKWLPETGTRKTFEALDGLWLVSGGKPVPVGLREFFSPEGRFKQGLKSAVQREARLRRMKKELIKASRNIWIDPVILPLLEKEVEKLQWPLEFVKKKKEFLGALKGLNIKLYPYQVEGVQRALEAGKLLLGDDMGLGKTVQATAWAECLLRTKTAKRVIVITPAALKAQWKREWRQVSGRELEVVDGTQEDRRKVYEGKSPVIVMNYELLWRDLEIIQGLTVDAIILDEAQRMKNYSSQTARSVKQLTPRFRLVLTGTPMENRISELSSLMDWIDDHVLAPSWRLHSQLIISGGGKEHGTKGVRGLNLLREKIDPHFLRRTRSQVLTELPGRTDSLRVVPFTEEQKAVHDDFAARVAILMSQASSRPLRPEEHLRLMSHLTQMRVVSNALAQYEYGEMWESLRNDEFPGKRIPQIFSPKLAEFRNLVEGLLSQGNVKIVIFSQWQRMLRLAHWSVKDLLRQEGVEAVFFTGREKSAQRNENIVRFHDEPDVRLFFSSDAGGVGLNLQKAATVCINLELPWNPAVLDQRIARIHRLGQKKPIQVYSLVTEKSIEERIAKLVEQKKAVFSALFDGTSDQVIFDDHSTFYSQVRSVVNESDLKKITSSLEADPEAQEEVTELDDRIENDPIDHALPELGRQHFTAAFKDMKIEKTAEGTIRIEASQQSAQLLAMMFKSMSDIFANSGGGEA